MKILQQMIIAGLVVCSLTACAGNNVNQVSTETATTQQQATPNKASGVWIDVRSAEEFASGHLQGALNITNSEIADRIASIEPNKNAPINLYCRSGNRAEVARTTLLNLGYTNVTNHGGYDDLVKQGLK